MEERGGGGKDKKYVLYTVVGSDRGQAGCGIWMIRLLLGLLVLVALAVVPYISLRLAQVSDRTLVVFQPVPVHNHTYHHVRTEHNANEAHPRLRVPPLPMAVSSGTDSGVPLLPSSTPSQEAGSENASLIVVVHESDVSVSVLENTSGNTTIESFRNDTVDEHEMMPMEASLPLSSLVSVSNLTRADYGVEFGFPPEEPHNSSGVPASTQTRPLNESYVPPVKIVLISTQDATATTVTNEASLTSTTSVQSHNFLGTSPVVTIATSLKVEGSSTVASVESESKKQNPIPANSQSSKAKKVKPLRHKLAYVATSSSGIHIGGICMWKTDTNVTRWSYFFENIPMEYQSSLDSTDHEMKALTVALRLWSPSWDDYHVVLKSQNQAILTSDHKTRSDFICELEQAAEGHFTYEFEWRSKKTDKIVRIAYSLARLYRNYRHWFNIFKGQIEELLGHQDWAAATTENRMEVSKSIFVSNDDIKILEEIETDKVEKDPLFEFRRR